MKVKIKKDSIRKNPEAGKTKEMICTNVDITFTISNDNFIPNWLKEDEDFAVQNCLFVEKGRTNLECHLINYEKRNLFFEKRPKGISDFKENRNFITVHHAPLREYLFEYEETYLTCSHCKEQIERKEILEDWEDDEYYYQECPKCHERNTFEKIEFELLKDVLESKEQYYCNCCGAEVNIEDYGKIGDGILCLNCAEGK